MANKGRAYPRLFERDFSIRNPNGVFAYLAKQIACKGVGANWPSGWPANTFLISEPGEADYDTGVVTWRWPATVSPSPDKRIEAELILTDAANYWRSRWRIWTSATFYWECEVTRYNVFTPPAFPDTFGDPWISSTGITNYLIGITQIRPATWGEV